MRCIKLLCLLCLFTNIQASTHWMVTESGLIQPKEDSPYVMANPYDLLAFLNQDTRWDNIHTLYYDLTKRQEVIDKLWSTLEKSADINTQLSLNENCLKAGPLNLIQWYTTFLDDGRRKSLNTRDFLLDNFKIQGNTDIPDCKRISSLTFSMLSFDHLEGVIQRQNLTTNPERKPPDHLSPFMNVEEFGHWLAVTLRKNSSSWLHYNMASLYWRVRGNAAKAIECSRRAIHYAPRVYKDIALQSMGSTLHRSGKSKDAIIVLGAAVDHCPTIANNHFVLGNAYAVVGDYNSSLRHLEECLNLDPNFEYASKHIHGVHCHTALVHLVMSMQELLKNLRVELREYGQREAHWLKSQTAFVKTMKHAEDFDYKVIENNCQKMSELTGLDIKAVKKDGDKNSLIQYFLESAMYDENWLKDRGVHAVDSALSFHRFIKHITKHTNMVTNLIQTDHLRITEETTMPDMGSDVSPLLNDGYSMVNEGTESQQASDDTTSSSEIENDISQYETGIVMYPNSMKISRNSEDFDIEPDWPSLKHCKENAHMFPKIIDAVYPMFLPLENKGLRLKSLLTTKIGVPADVEHDLPWYPPTCPLDEEAASYIHKESQRHQLRLVGGPEYLRQKLLEYVADGPAAQAKHMQDAEIGHRIYAAMQMKLAPKWFLYTISSLYWRVRGNNMNALHCLMTASRSAPARYKDIVLASLASVFLEMGYLYDALGAAEEALKLSLYEPTINFILAELSMLKKHRNTQLFHLKQVLRVQPEYMNGLARDLINAWACIIKKVVSDLELKESDVCTEMQPEMVCEKDGTDCHMTKIQCFSSRAREDETNTLIRMLELKEETDQHSDFFDAHLFDLFIINMPADRKDKVGHRRNFDAMKKVFTKTLKGCGQGGCSNIIPEQLSITEDDCAYQDVQLSYWLYTVSFTQFFHDAELKLEAEIADITPSNKKIPDCKLQSDALEDFFQERLLTVDTDGWQPLIHLINKLLDMFSIFEFSTLGAKLAKYVETRPQSWAGLVMAGWWCGAGGRGVCASRCFAAAHRLAPRSRTHHATDALVALLHMQSKQKEARNIAYLAFYILPKSKFEAFLVAVSHSYVSQHERALWMYKYALTIDDKFLPVKACLHATLCLMLIKETRKKSKTTNINLINRYVT